MGWLGTIGSGVGLLAYLAPLVQPQCRGQKKTPNLASAAAGISVQDALQILLNVQLMIKNYARARRYGKWNSAQE